MPENEANAAGSSAADSQGQRPASNADPTPAASSSGAASGEIRDPEAKARADAEAQQRIIAKLEARVKEYEKRDADAELARLGDLEKVTKQYEQANTQIAKLKATIANQAVQLEAAELHFAKPAHAAKLIGDQLEYGEDGAPTNVKQLLEALLKSDPYLKSPDPTQQQPQPPRAGMSATNAGRGAGAQPEPQKVDWKNPPRLSDPRVWQQSGQSGNENK